MNAARVLGVLVAVVAAFGLGYAAAHGGADEAAAQPGVKPIAVEGAAVGMPAGQGALPALAPAPKGEAVQPAPRPTPAPTPNSSPSPPSGGGGGGGTGGGGGGGTGGTGGGGGGGGGTGGGGGIIEG